MSFSANLVPLACPIPQLQEFQMSQIGRQLSGKLLGAVALVAMFVSFAYAQSGPENMSSVVSQSYARLSHTRPLSPMLHVNRADSPRLTPHRPSRTLRLAIIHRPSSTRRTDRRDTGCLAA